MPVMSSAMVAGSGTVLTVLRVLANLAELAKLPALRHSSPPEQTRKYF